MTPADLFAAHTGLAYALARKLGWNRVQACGIELDDLVQVGLIALWKCSPYFDESRGIRFSTFAGHYIQGAILEELRTRRPGGRHFGNHVRVSTGHDLDALAGGHDVVEQVAALERDEIVRGTAYQMPVRLRRIAVDMVRGRRVAETARTIGISETRVCQLRPQVRERMRRALRRAGVA